MMTTTPAHRRAGFTIVEMIVALTIFGVITTAALSMLRTQFRAFDTATERMHTLQNMRFAANELEKDLRTAGSGVPGSQPFLVHAGGDVVAFNADYVSNVPNDPFAVYSDTLAPDDEVFALPRVRAITIPGTSSTYPDTSYRAGDAPSPAETIVFYFEPDTTTGRGDDFVLLRRANDAEPEIVARDLLRTDDDPFFEYYRLTTTDSTPDRVEPVSNGQIPLHHSAAIHMSNADTGSVARIDSVRAVRVNFTATNGRTGADEDRVVISRLVNLPNAGLAILTTCGDAPILGTDLDAQLVSTGGGEYAVRLTWDAATDETGGEADIVRYVLWRRDASVFDWDDPFHSIPAGHASYSYLDTNVDSGDEVQYGVSAQDCTPTLSGMETSNTVQIP